MKKERVRAFTDKQRKLAKKIARKLGIKKFNIIYVEYIPGVRIEPETGQRFISDSSQQLIPHSIWRHGKRQIKVIIEMKGAIKPEDKKQLDKIMKRYYRVNNGRIIYFVKPNSI